MADFGHQAGAGSAWHTPHMLKVIPAPGTAYVQWLPFPAIDAVHIALHAASEEALAAARQPCAQEGFWQADVLPWQQCPCFVHLAAQAALLARAVAMSRAAAPIVSKCFIMRFH